MTIQEAIDKIQSMAVIAETSTDRHLRSSYLSPRDAEALRLALRVLRGQEIAERRGWRPIRQCDLWYLPEQHPLYVDRGSSTPTDALIAAEEWVVANVENQSKGN